MVVKFVLMWVLLFTPTNQPISQYPSYEVCTEAVEIVGEEFDCVPTYHPVVMPVTREAYNN